MKKLKPQNSYLVVAIFNAIAAERKNIYLNADGALSAWRGGDLGYRLACKKAVSLSELYRLDSLRCKKIWKIIKCAGGELSAMSDTLRICAELAEEWIAANPRRLEKLLEQLNTQKNRPSHV